MIMFDTNIKKYVWQVYQSVIAAVLIANERSKVLALPYVVVFVSDLDINDLNAFLANFYNNAV